MNLLDEFSKVTSDLQVFPLPQARTLTMDDKETLLVFVMTKDGIPQPENTIAIWIVNDTITSYINSTFRTDWEKIKGL